MTFGDYVRKESDEGLAEMFTLIGMGQTPEYDVIPYNPVDKTADYWSWLRYLKREAPEQKQHKTPLCPTCAHANMSVTDDFADCLCAKSGGYEGGKTECKDYERRGG